MKPKPFQKLRTSQRLPFGPYVGFVDSVHDGDTVTVCLSVGLDCYPYRSIRLRGVYAPELNESGGMEAESALCSALTAEELVIVHTELRPGAESKSFDRWVATVTRLRDGANVNQMMIDYLERHGIPRRVPGPVGE